MNSPIEIKDKAKTGSGIKVEAFRKNTRKTNPHKHNSYLELVYLSRGSGTHAIDVTSYDIEPPILFIIRQDQLHFWDMTAEPEGYVLILKKAFADDFFDHELKYLFSQLQHHTTISIPEAHVAIVEQLFQLLVLEAPQTAPGITFLSLLKALLAKLLTNLPSGSERKNGSGLCQRYIEHLSRQEHLVNNVSHHAQLLHTTPQNLNAACKKETGHSASDILSDHIMAEAKRLLLYTRLSVAEIGYRLGFKDNSHFTKYFKKKSGINPSTLKK
ncbi:AraC family transcriptional regulator [Niabella insulamsoli]|uniref:helix-turn-helix domain-containing protein n=1 Tax=Niabella insulamsoli TaxID=3144874 RepID=UPI0031FD4E59